MIILLVAIAVVAGIAALVTMSSPEMFERRKAERGRQELLRLYPAVASTRRP